MAVSKEKILELVKLLYTPTCKTFYVNSKEGDEFCSPLGVFVSLGMTTSLRTLENIKGFLEGSGKYEAKIVEICSKRMEGQFLNFITNDTDPRQYKIEDLPSTIMDKEKAEEELAYVKSKLDTRNSLDTITEFSPRATKLQYLVDRLNDSQGWNSHMIQKLGDSDYRIFHLYVNYEKREGLEYRLGILVNEVEDFD